MTIRSASGPLRPAVTNRSSASHGSAVLAGLVEDRSQRCGRDLIRPDDRGNDRHAERHPGDRRHHQRTSPARKPGAESRPGIRLRLLARHRVAEPAKSGDRQRGRLELGDTPVAALQVREGRIGRVSQFTPIDKVEQGGPVPPAGARQVDHSDSLPTSSRMIGRYSSPIRRCSSKWPRRRRRA